MKKTTKETSVKYEEAMSKLEEIAKNMENSVYSIDEMVEKVAEAKHLILLCKERLMAADKQIKEL